MPPTSTTPIRYIAAQCAVDQAWAVHAAAHQRLLRALDRPRHTTRLRSLAALNHLVSRAAHLNTSLVVARAAQRRLSQLHEALLELEAL